MTEETYSKRRWWNLGNIYSRVLESFSTRLKTFSLPEAYFYVCLCLLTDSATSQKANLSDRTKKITLQVSHVEWRNWHKWERSHRACRCVCRRFLFIGRWCRYRSDQSVYRWRTAEWRMLHDAVVALMAEVKMYIMQTESWQQ